MNVPPDKELTYFINSDSGFSKEKMTVSYRAFYPTKKCPTKLSVCCISSLTESEIWEIGIKHVEGKIRIKARADFPARIFYENEFLCEKNIKAILTPYPYAQHADITPIPIIKEDRNEIFSELALFCKLVIRPDDI